MNYSNIHINGDNNTVVKIQDDYDFINDVKYKLPGRGYNSTVIDNKVYINGYELVNGKWKKTLRAIFHKYF